MGQTLGRLSRRWVLVVVALLLLVQALAAAAQQCPADWAWANPLPQGNSLNGVAAGGGLFVAVGAHGTILTSQDGSRWQTRVSGVTSDLYGAAFGGSEFVAVGAGGALLTSPDGTLWQSVSTGVPEDLRGVTFMGDTPVAVGDGGVILTRPPGSSWSAQYPARMNSYRAVAASPGLAVAVGFQGYAGCYATSSDGIHWSSFTDLATWGVAENGGLFVKAGGAFVSSSRDGVTWSPTSLEATFFGIAAYRDGFVAVGYGGATAASPDGLAWTVTPASGHASFLGVASTGPTAVAAGDYGLLASIQDGQQWTACSAGALTQVDGLVSGPPFVAVGSDEDYPSILLTSLDARQWAALPLQQGASPLRVYRARGQYIAAGGNTILTSADGATWSVVTLTDFGDTLSGLAYGPPGFVAVGKWGAVATSPDGAAWEVKNPMQGSLISDVAYGNGQYLAVDFAGGSVHASQDGVTWAERPTGTGYMFYAATFGQGKFVVVGQAGLILTSADGITWRLSLSGIEDPQLALRGVTYANAGFIATGDQGMILTSPDGDVWTPISEPLTAHSLICAVWDGTQIVAGGEGGTILAKACSWDVAPPAVSDVRVRDRPPGLIIKGSNLQAGLRVYLDGIEWPLVHLRAGKKVTVSGGNALSAVLPRGIPVLVRLENPDHGTLTLTVTR